MSSLQESRRELMVQLEGLMKLLKVTNTQRPAGLQLSAPPATFQHFHPFSSDL